MCSHSSGYLLSWASNHANRSGVWKKKPSNFLVYFLAVPAGLFIGLLDYRFLQFPPLVNLAASGQLVLIILVLGFSLGFLEELIFRGILLHLGQDLFGDWGSMFFISLLYSILQFGYQSWSHGLLAFSVSLFFSGVVLKMRTIYPISLVHGIINVVNFGLVPIWLIELG